VLIRTTTISTTPEQHGAQNCNVRVGFEQYIVDRGHGKQHQQISTQGAVLFYELIIKAHVKI
jgi:hypothetical protein